MSGGVYIAQKWCDPDTGRLTSEANDLLQRLLNGQETYSINTLLSGSQAAQDAATVALAEASEANTKATTADSNAAAAGTTSTISLTKSADMAKFGSGTSVEALTSNTITITITGGTGPYDWTLATTLAAGEAITPSSTGATGVAGPTFTLSSSATLGVNDFANASYTITVEDTATGDTKDISVAASFSNFDISV